jgi:hypothetical protein
MKRLISSLLFVALTAVTAAAADHASERKISTVRAKALVMAALTSEQRRLPKLGADQDPPSSSRFWFFTVTWAGPPEGSVVVGNYAVDPYTGDVFSSTASCYEYSNKGLRALQAQVRSSLHLTRSKYQRLKTKGPLCEE